MARSEETLRIDSQILQCIGCNGDDFMSIAGHMARRFHIHELPVIDRGLQRLRKAGKIRYLGGKGRLWQVV